MLDNIDYWNDAPVGTSKVSLTLLNHGLNIMSYMDAFLLAAGLGTRLKPFTDRYPNVCLN